jgi:hypothetical protein
LAVLALASCGGGMDAGAYLEVDKIPVGTTEIEVVLASAPSVVSGQHTDASFNATTSVPYYVQRGSTGGVAPVAGRDNLLVRIEPSIDPSAATDVVPIVIARAKAGDDSSILAMATLPPSSAGSGMIDLAISQVAAVYEVTLETATPSAMRAKPAASEVLAIPCPASVTNAVARDGIAWTSGSGASLRLVRLDGSAGDGSDLPLDVDCDGYIAGSDDCDDLRSDVYPDAPDSCDGVDENCAGDPLWAMPCGSGGPTEACASGRALCDENHAASSGLVCNLLPVVGCGAGEWVCRLTRPGASGAATLCAPAVGQVALPQTVCATPPCTVRVGHAPDAWDAKVGLEAMGMLAPLDHVKTDDQGDFELIAIAPPAGSDTSTEFPAGDLGVIDLFVSEGNGGPETYFAVGLAPVTDTTQQCNAFNSGPGSASGSDLWQMTCQATLQ